MALTETGEVFTCMMLSPSSAQLLADVSTRGLAIERLPRPRFLESAAEGGEPA